jgi:hypothetical protein
VLAAAQAHPVSSSNLQAAAPFLITCAVVIVGAVLSLLVINRVRADYEDIVAEYEASLNRDKRLAEANIKVTPTDRTARITPEYLADTGNWLIDASGIFVSFMGPLVGLILLHDRFNTLIFIVYTVVILAIVVGVVLFVLKVPPSGYPGQPLVEGLPFRRVWIFTPIVILTASVNVIAGLLILIAGP